MALLLESLDFSGFVARQHLGPDIVDPDRVSHHLSRRPAVPGEEQHADTEIVERLDGYRRRRTNPIGDCDETKRSAIRRHVEYGLGFRPQPLGFAVEPRRPAVSVEQLAIAHQHGATAHGRLNAVSRDGFEVRGRLDDERTLPGSLDNGRGKRVFGRPIRRGRWQSGSASPANVPGG